MNPPDHEDAPLAGARQQLIDLSRAYLVSRSIHAVAELGVADHVGDAPVEVEALARHTGTRPELLQRVLRLLAAYGVFEEAGAGRFGHTPLSRLLREDAEGSLRAGLRHVNGAWWAAAGDLLHSLRTGEPAFAHLHGAPMFSWLKDHPEQQERFDAGMANQSRAGDQAVVDAYDFSGVLTFVDLGGGRGGLVRAILARYPEARGTLFDQPQVLARAPAPEGRFSHLAGDFFQAVPPGADAYLFKGVLHDFPDDRCVEILRACRRAMGRASRLLLIERVPLPDNRPHPAKHLDVLMMILLAGQERSPEQWGALLASAGLKLVRQIPTRSELTILEAAPADAGPPEAATR
ncbi:MAG TPA: methyltransferase [Myxococcales bacterium]|nr:methyltransferase [Myxococcales bacterium]